MDHLAQVALQPEPVAGSDRRIPEYISLIRSERLLRGDGGQSPEELLMAAQKRFQQKKAYMEGKK